ncbi:AraC family transcriptional regulator [Derxia lacustris]|uniref:AraC family transcriptional regulator n=1 Tax=Derxia lacustris TaxID=764842 RepID=UPI000A16CEC4|nr:AraC family transcriptional regulator [Derxia lacustris]
MNDLAPPASTSAARLGAMRRSINNVIVLADVAQARDMATAALLAGTSLRPRDLDDPARTHSVAEEFQLIRNLLRHCGDPPGLGIDAGVRYRFTTLGPVGFAMVSSHNLRGAYDMAVRYSDLGPSLLRSLHADAGAALGIRLLDDELPPDLRRFALERTTAVGLTVFGGLLGRPLLPERIDFSFAAPADPGLYERFFGCRPRFGQPASSIVFSAADANARLSLGNAMALRMAEAHCRLLLAAARQHERLADRVRALIHASHAETRALADMRSVANALCLSERTLRRHLRDEGTTFTALCDGVRESLAEALLAIPRLPVERIAEQLGYSETASFVHAFRRWKGSTPRAYRLARHGMPAAGADDSDD